MTPLSSAPSQLSSISDRYIAVALFSDGWWRVDVPELPGVLAHTSEAHGADGIIREAIAIKLSAHPSGFEIDVIFVGRPPTERSRRGRDRPLTRSFVAVRSGSAAGRGRCEPAPDPLFAAFNPGRFTLGSGKASAADRECGPDVLTALGEEVHVRVFAAECVGVPRGAEPVEERTNESSSTPQG
jgi:hypothetical protein